MDKYLDNASIEEEITTLQAWSCTITYWPETYTLGNKTPQKTFTNESA